MPLLTRNARETETAENLAATALVTMLVHRQRRADPPYRRAVAAFVIAMATLGRV